MVTDEFPLRFVVIGRFCNKVFYKYSFTVRFSHTPHIKLILVWFKVAPI